MFTVQYAISCGGIASLMVGALASKVRVLQGHCVVFLGKTLFRHSVSLHPGVRMGT